MSVPYTFHPGDVIESAKVNANFEAVDNLLVGITTTTIGSPSDPYTRIYLDTLALMDNAFDNFLQITLDEDLSANRTLKLTVGNANRTFAIGANSAIAGTALCRGQQSTSRVVDTAYQPTSIVTSLAVPAIVTFSCQGTNPVVEFRCDASNPPTTVVQILGDGTADNLNGTFFVPYPNYYKIAVTGGTAGTVQIVESTLG